MYYYKLLAYSISTKHESGHCIINIRIVFGSKHMAQFLKMGKFRVQNCIKSVLLFKAKQ